MAHPTLEDARRLSDWEPELGVVSVYLAFDAADRGGAWRTELRNGLDALLEAAKDSGHERRVALRAVAKRITERYEDGDHRPPPRGEAGFVEVAEKGGVEHWWGTGAEPSASACARLGERPSIVPLVDLACRGEARGIAIVALERVRLLLFAEGELTEIEDWELEITSLDWRERKAKSGGGNRAVASSGKDEYGKRLEHNRHKFLGEAGELVARTLEERGISSALAFGPTVDLESFQAGVHAPKVTITAAGGEDLISVPTGKLHDTVAAAVENGDAERESELVVAALEEVRGGGRGASGLQDVGEAVTEGRVERLILAASVEDAAAEGLVRGALASGAEIRVVHGPAAEALAPAEGVAATLRY